MQTWVAAARERAEVGWGSAAAARERAEVGWDCTAGRQTRRKGERPLSQPTIAQDSSVC